MAKLTAMELRWLTDMQKLLNKCPSNRIGFATTGDNMVSLFDVSRYDEILKRVEDNNDDFLPAASKIKATFEVQLFFPNPVESTSG